MKLSILNSSSLFIDMIYGNEFNLKIQRSKYEELCMDLWEKCIKIVDETLKLAQLKKEEIDEIILVGESTWTSKIKKMVKNHFNGK